MAVRQEKSPTVLLVPCGPVEHEDLDVLIRALSARGMKVATKTRLKSGAGSEANRPLILAKIWHNSCG